MRRIVPSVFIGIAIVFCHLSPAEEVVYDRYYISASTGSDETGEGTLSSPWASITYALTEIAPTEIRPATLYLAAGDYGSFDPFPEYVDLSGCHSSEDWTQDLLTPPHELDRKRLSIR